MSYESWRISYQSSEQAARAAFDEIATLRAELDGAAKSRNAAMLLYEAARQSRDALLMQQHEWQGALATLEGEREANTQLTNQLAAAEARAERLAKSLKEIIDDLETRSDWKEGTQKGVVDIGQGVYLRGKAALAVAGPVTRQFGLGAEAKGQTMDANKRAALIDQLDRSFQMMPRWAQTAAVHAMGAPTTNPETGKPFGSFRECISVAADHTLETLREDFEDNGDLLPSVPTQ